MRQIFLLGWLMLPIGWSLFHFGPGQDLQKLDDVDQAVREAKSLQSAGRSAEAVDAYSKAISLIPEDRSDLAKPIRLERAKAQLESQQLGDAFADLTNLVEELEKEPSKSPSLLASSKEMLAKTQYYMTWLLRLEGEPREVWEPVIESARQTFRSLAEDADAESRSADGKRTQEDLEAAIKLARMDLSELQMKKLPSCCQGCCAGKCMSKSGKERKGNSKRPSKAQNPDGRNSGTGEPDGKGS